jgi:transcriptional regulator with XRE-family HTH domain
MADMDPATLNRLERGTGNPNLKTLERVAGALGVGVADLLPKVLRLASLEPSFNDVLAGERRTAGVEVSEAYFVPLEEGEEEDTVTLRIYYVRLFEGGEPILQAMREASPEEAAEAAKMRQQREKSGRVRE